MKIPLVGIVSSLLLSMFYVDESNSQALSNLVSTLPTQQSTNSTVVVTVTASPPAPSTSRYWQIRWKFSGVVIGYAVFDYNTMNTSVSVTNATASYHADISVSSPVGPNNQFTSTLILRRLQWWDIGKVISVEGDAGAGFSAAPPPSLYFILMVKGIIHADELNANNLSNLVSTSPTQQSTNSTVVVTVTASPPANFTSQYWQIRWKFSGFVIGTAVFDYNTMNTTSSVTNTTFTCADINVSSPIGPNNQFTSTLILRRLQPWDIGKVISVESNAGAGLSATSPTSLYFILMVKGMFYVDESNAQTLSNLVSTFPTQQATNSTVIVTFTTSSPTPCFHSGFLGYIQWTFDGTFIGYAEFYYYPWSTSPSMVYPVVRNYYITSRVNISASFLIGPNNQFTSTLILRELQLNDSGKVISVLASSWFGLYATLPPLYFTLMVKDCPSNISSDITVEAISYIFNAQGKFKCSNNGELFYSNGTRPSSSDTICLASATWSGQDNLQCWSDCPSNISSDITVEAISYIFNAQGTFTCSNNGELFYSNGTRPSSSDTTCLASATWSGQDNLQCWSVSGCFPTTVQSGSKYNTSLNFGSSNLWESALSEEKCSNSNRSLATITCVGTQPNIDDKVSSRKNLLNGYNVTSLYIISCDLTLETLLDQINSALLPVGGANTTKITADLRVLTLQSASLTVDDIITASNALKILEKRTKNETLQPNALYNIIHTINQLDVAVENVESTMPYRSTTIKSNLLRSLHTFVARVNLPSNNETLTLLSRDITVQLANIGQQSIKGESNSSIYSDLVFKLGVASETINSNNIVTFPSEIFRKLSQSSSQRDNQGLFVTSITNESFLGSTQSISQVVTVGEINLSHSDLTSLQFSIEFANVKIPERERRIKNSRKTRLEDAQLTTWNYDTLSWDDAECSQELHFTSIYSCHRLASYSILFSSRIVPSNLALSIVSYIGCGISVLSLLATIFIHLFYREFRIRFSTPALVNTSICLLCVYLLFAGGVPNASHSAACNGLTFLLHYAALSCLMWMCINATQMYRAFTDMTYDRSETKKLKNYLIAYLLPFVIVMTNFSVTVLYLDKFKDTTSIFYESFYRLRQACWLKAPSFYWGFLLPAGVALVFNYIIFTLVVRKLTCEKVEIRSSAKKKSLKDQLINAIALATLMGLTWIFGYFLIISDDIIYQTVMQWLFMFTNVSQGLTLFILSCVRRKDVRKVWFPAGCLSKSNKYEIQHGNISTERNNAIPDGRSTESYYRITTL